MIRIAVLRPRGDEAFPPVDSALDEPNGLLAAGGDLAPERLLAAYRQGIFPWFSEGDPILWWSPDPRAVFATDTLHISTRLRRWLKHCRWTIRANTAFDDVMQACAAPRATRHGTWITRDMFGAYRSLHDLGFAHSVEVFDAETQLVGGIYGVSIGRMFFGESMFSRATNGSKVALIALCRALREWGFPLLDAQVASPHLSRMGASDMPRQSFVRHVGDYVGRAAPAAGCWHEDWPCKVAAELLQ